LRRCKAKWIQSLLVEVKFHHHSPKTPQRKVAVAGPLPSGQGWRLRNKPDGPGLKVPGQGHQAGQEGQEAIECGGKGGHYCWNESQVAKVKAAKKKIDAAVRR